MSSVSSVENFNFRFYTRKYYFGESSSSQFLGNSLLDSQIPKFRQFRILSYFLLTVPGKTSKTDRNSCSHQLCECDREFAMCLQKYLPCPKSKAVCKNKKRLWQNLLMGFGSGKGVHDPKHKVCPRPGPCTSFWIYIFNY